jgi:hypothetical protein
MEDLLEVVGGTLRPITLVFGRNGVGKTELILAMGRRLGVSMWNADEDPCRRTTDHSGLLRIEAIARRLRDTRNLNRVYRIDKPESGLHPTLQVELGDLLIAAVQGDNPNRVIVETHSEHLMLRLQRRIRETGSGSLPKGHPGLRPEQLGIVYVGRQPEIPDTFRRFQEGWKEDFFPSGVALKNPPIRLRVIEEGEFRDHWPDGFFRERAKELF